MYTLTLSAKFSASKQKHPLHSLWIGLLLTTLPYEPIQQCTTFNPSIQSFNTVYKYLTTHYNVVVRSCKGILSFNLCKVYMFQKELLTLRNTISAYNCITVCYMLLIDAEYGDLKQSIATCSSTSIQTIINSIAKLILHVDFRCNFLMLISMTMLPELCLYNNMQLQCVQC